MSFSARVKDELSKLETPSNCCKKSELAGILRAGAVMRKLKDTSKLVFISENELVSRHVFSMMKAQYKNGPELFILKTHRFKDHAVFRLDFTPFTREKFGQSFLQSMGISFDESSSILTHNAYPLTKKCCRRSYVRGCFLATGSISDPDRSYHLEVTFPSRVLCEEYRELLVSYELHPRAISRKGHWLVYLKEGQEIVDFLNITGAHGALMSLENIRILKDVRNNVNRILNCETANLDKTVNASVRQVEQIQYLADHIGLESLPEALREIAALRLEHAEVSLMELGEMLSPKLTKSGVNHRLRKLEQIVNAAKERADK